MRMLRADRLAAPVLALAAFANLFLGSSPARAVQSERKPPARLSLPLKPKSVRFAVIGDAGTGERGQYETARQMTAFHERFPFDFVLMLGDNIYGGKSPADFKRKFEAPYASLLEGGVKFYACLGNHDNSNERFYEPFHMEGKRYYSLRKGNVELFALDSNYMDPEQLDWLKKALEESRAAWKICYFHHPLYSDGKMHGPNRDLRAQLEPIFVRNGVDAVFSGHEHSYERLKPQKSVQYFILGSSGKLRQHDFRPAEASEQAVKQFDSDQAFLLVEVAGGELYFQAVARSGETVDFGVLRGK